MRRSYFIVAIVASSSLCVGSFLAACGTVVGINPESCGDAGCDGGVSGDATADAGNTADGSSDAAAAADAGQITDASAGDAGDAGDASGFDAGCVAPSDPGLTTLAAGVRPIGLVIDACNVYWTDQATGGVTRVAKTGGAASMIATSVAPLNTTVMSEGLAIDAQNLYWSEYIDTTNGADASLLRQGDVVKTTLQGHVSTKIWTGNDGPSAVSVDGTSVFVLQNGDLERAPVGGGGSTVIASGPSAYGLTLAGARLFWTTYNSIDEVRTALSDGGAFATFTSGSGAAGTSSTAVAHDDTNLYWGDTAPGAGAGSIYMKPLAGGAQKLLYTGAIEPLGIAVDAAYLYVATGSAGSILKINIADSTVTSLAMNQGWPYGIAVDDGFVYWANNDGGANSIMRIAK